MGHSGGEDNWALVPISQRLSVPNMKEKAIKVLQTHLCIAKYLA